MTLFEWAGILRPIGSIPEWLWWYVWSAVLDELDPGERVYAFPQAASRPGNWLYAAARIYLQEISNASKNVQEEQGFYAH